MMVFLGGPSGVGKSTIAKLIQEKIPDSFLVNYYTIMRCVGNELGLTNAQVLSRWKWLEMKMYDSNLKDRLQSGETVILDTHYSFQEKIDPSLAFTKRHYPTDIPIILSHGDDFVQALEKTKVLTGAFLVTAHPEDIIRRQESDEKRIGTISEDIDTVRIEVSTEHKLWAELVDKIRRIKARYVSGSYKNECNVEVVADAIFKDIQIAQALNQ